ncbi:MAG: hypothetical protein FWD52_09755 [Candidatus Bathyarchaeota archaeon]|nr:hypothetical protein [Candidatus Termiticorpusculum sp.]
MNNNNKKKNITSKENNSSNLFTFVRASDLPLKQKKEHLIKDLSEEQPSTPTTLQTMTEPCLTYVL